MRQRDRYAGALLLVAALQSAAWADGMADMAKKLAPHENIITNGFFGLIALFVGLVIWEVVDQKRASRSSLDIAKLAAAAAKKQSAAGAPSGNLSRLSTPPTTRPFAPPPPPPPSKAAPPPPPPPPAGDRPSPFAAPAADSQGGSEMFPAAQEASSEGSVDSTVAFSPNDAGSSGGWADLLQRVRAGEPEAASFEEAAPSAPPSTEDESFAMPSLDSGMAAQAAPPPPAAAAGSSSEAWEALLKRTTTGDGGPSDAPAPDGSKIPLNSDFQLPGQGAPPPAPSPPQPAFDFSASAEAPAAPTAFTQPLDAEPSTAPLGMGLGGASPFSLPVGGDDAGPPAMAPPPSGFNFPADNEGLDPSSFSLPGAGGIDAPAPTFKLPGAGSIHDPNVQTQSFQLPTAGGGGDAGNNPFGFMGESSAPPPGPPSQAGGLNDLFGGAGAAPGAPPAGGVPSFQLPTGGGGFDADATNRTISLDFAQGGGQAPPPPFPKTEG